jgi:hypothetical protein
LKKFLIKNSIGPAALCALLLLGCGLKANPVAPASGAASGDRVRNRQLQPKEALRF